MGITFGDYLIDIGYYDPPEEERRPMDDRNIFAYTAPGSNYPEYLSISRRGEEIYITVRSPSGGPTAEMCLPYDQLDELIRALRGARPANIYGSGDKSAFRHIPVPHQVPTDSIEKARMKRPRKNQDNGF